MFFGTRLLHMMSDPCGKFQIDICNVLDLVKVRVRAPDVDPADMLEFE